MSRKLVIHNSIAQFVIFIPEKHKEGIEVRVEDENVWLTQKLIAKLFNTSISTVNEHLKNIYSSFELKKKGTVRKFRIVQKEGHRSVSRDVEHYNLETIISLGYRINSDRAVEFRKWATKVLKDFTIKGYVLDAERLKNGQYLDKKYFEELLLEIRDIRASERNFYQKITDIYSTAIDYNQDSILTKNFFASVQNKLHFAVHKHTAAELIVDRVNHRKTNMGLETWKKAPKGKILKSDVVIAKNYLDKNEIKHLNRIVTMYLDYAEDQAEKNIPMTMGDWVNKLDVFLKFNERDILEDLGKVTMEIAKSLAEDEFEKYRPLQDKLYKSDFDTMLEEVNKSLKTKRSKKL